MLRITQQTDASSARSYFAASDYYREGQELVGSWGGKAAAMLGLEGAVGKAEFDSMCENRDPRTGERLTVRNKSERTVGYDFTWSASKSVSLLYAMTEDKRLLNAFQGAVDETMRDIEAEMKTRVRKGRRDENQLTGNAAWATFYHFTSRPVEGVADPQMHAHCFVFNATWHDSEQRFKAGQFRDLKRDAPFWQAAFRVRLANRLQELGLPIERKRDDFEVAGLAPALLKKFSRRTAVIEDVATERGITDPRRKAELGAQTREHKNDRLTWSQLRQNWKERLTDAEHRSVSDALRPGVPSKPIRGGEKEAVDHALSHCFERASVVPERGLLTEALRRGVGGVTVEAVQKELASRPLLGKEVEGRRLVTSEDVLLEEEELVAFAREGRGRCKPLVGFDRPLTRDWLNTDQKKAVRHLWESPDKVMLLRGAAGTGKSTLLLEAVEGIQAAGHRVVALAPTAEASRGVLRDELGLKDADTVSRFLVDPTLQAEARSGVLLVDESSLLGARTLSRVFDLAGRLDARVILVGDAQQHAAVERGAAFRLLQQRSGAPVVEVKDIRRQKGRYRDAVRAPSAGKTQEGFDQLDRMGWVVELPTAEREQRIAEDYLQAVSSKKSNGQQRTALVISPTHAEGNRITAAIRKALRAAKKLGKEQTFQVWTPANLTEAERADAVNLPAGTMLQFHQNVPGHRNGSRMVVREGEALPLGYASRYQVYQPAELPVAVGDRLRVTVNGKTKDQKHKLSNGMLLTCQGFTQGGDIIVDKGWVIDREFGHLAQGFCVTSHKSQGKTIDRALVVQSSLSLPASSSQQFYVSASRAREAVQIYTDDKRSLRDAICRDDPRMAALDLVQPKPRGLTQRFKNHLARSRKRATLSRPPSSHLPVAAHAAPSQREVHYYER